jgi:sodium-dependent phosphate cotransporter
LSLSPQPRRIQLSKILFGLLGLIVFLFALQLMRAGARGLAPILKSTDLLKTPVNSLGFGWLGAYMVLSGSPVAAASLSLFDGGAITELQTFTMINGSRMGASFIVLFIGFLYMLRGHEPKRSLSMGLLSLLTTWTIYVPVLIIGSLFIINGTFDAFRISAASELVSFIDKIFTPIVQWITGWAPGLLIFVVGIGVILLAFNLIDRALPDLQLGGTEFNQAPRLIYKPIVMFLLGCAVTTVSMSVSVSLSLLVPLSARGYIRRENVIPYIMGANITTFVDTLVASLFMNQPQAFTVVFVEMATVAIISVIILLTSYHLYERLILKIANRITANRRNFSVFMLLLVSTPIILLLIR